jgi:acyl-CoA synthetase (AMP-forming)/AMP-acid ligase II
VVATPSATLTEQELKDALRRRLAGYKVPRAIVLLPALPRSPTGKLELAQIRRLASGGTSPNALSRCPECSPRRGRSTVYPHRWLNVEELP